MLSFIRKHPVGVGAGAVVTVAALAWLAFGYFGVHLLFVDDVVDEAGPVFDAAPAALEEPADDVATSPTTTPPAEEPSGDADGQPAGDDEPDTETETETETEPEPASEPEPEPATPEIVTEFVGTFESDAHPTAGTATVLGNGTGQRFLRFEAFETDNGPDLNVYLVNSSTGDVSDYVDLGDLKGNIGDQNYEIPEGVDLSVYDEVVIWCVRFGVGFGDALLMAA